MTSECKYLHIMWIFTKDKYFSSQIKKGTRRADSKTLGRQPWLHSHIPVRFLENRFISIKAKLLSAIPFVTHKNHPCCSCLSSKPQQGNRFSLFLLQGLHGGVIKVPYTIPHTNISTFFHGTSPRRQNELFQPIGMMGTPLFQVLGQNGEAPSFEDVHFQLIAEQRLQSV